MIRYILKRLAMMIPVILGVAIVVFTVMFFCPGDPATAIMGENASDVVLAAKRAELGLDKPFIVQLGNFLYSFFVKFDLGESYVYNTPVWNEIITRLPRTAMFSLGCMLIEVLLGWPLGIMASVNQNKWPDKVCMIISMILNSLPSFFLALLLVIVFHLKLGWLPGFGIETWDCWILPIIAGSFGGMAGQARQTRSAMLEVIRADYISTARAKGVPEWMVIFKHALPNALIPLITLLGSGFATSLSGALIIESVFSIPGMGSYLQLGITQRDYPIVRGTVVVLAILFSLIMLLTDLAYAYVDPRIKSQYEGKARMKKTKKHKEVTANE